MTAPHWMTMLNKSVCRGSQCSAIRRCPVPPGDDRRIWCEQGQRDRLGMQRESSVHPHDDRFARAEPATHQDLGIQPRYRGIDMPPDHHQHAHGVLARGECRGFLGLVHVPLVDNDDKCQRVAAGHRSAGSPFCGEGFDDGGAGGVPQRGHEVTLLTVDAIPGRHGLASRLLPSVPTHPRGTGRGPCRPRIPRAGRSPSTRPRPRHCGGTASRLR